MIYIISVAKNRDSNGHASKAIPKRSFRLYKNRPSRYLPFPIYQTFSARPPASRIWPLRRPSRLHTPAHAPCTRTRHGAASAHTYTALTYFVRPYTLTGIRHTADPMTGGSTLTTQPATATPGGADSILPGYNASTETPSSNNQSTDGTNQSTDAPRRRHTDTLTLGRPGD